MNRFNHAIINRFLHILLINLHRGSPAIKTIFNVITCHNTTWRIRGHRVLEIFGHPLITFPAKFKAYGLVFLAISRVSHGPRSMLNLHLEGIQITFRLHFPRVAIAKDISRIRNFIFTGVEIVISDRPIERSILAPKVFCTKFYIPVIQQE